VNDRQRIRLAALAAARLGSVANALDAIGPDGNTVMGRMRDAQGPLHGRSYEAPARTGAGEGMAPSLGTDRALRDEADLDRALETAAKMINRVVAIVAGWPPPHAATATERASLGLGDGPWCVSCARVTGSDGAPRREPIRADLTNPTDVEGRLAEPAWLCRWCYGAVRDWGRVPTIDEAARHDRGLRVAWPDDVPRPKEASA
jgi:hypothetical protein